MDFNFICQKEHSPSAGSGWELLEATNSWFFLLSLITVMANPSGNQDVNSKWIKTTTKKELLTAGLKIPTYQGCLNNTPQVPQQHNKASDVSVLLWVQSGQGAILSDWATNSRRVRGRSPADSWKNHEGKYLMHVYSCYFMVSFCLVLLVYSSSPWFVVVLWSWLLLSSLLLGKAVCQEGLLLCWCILHYCLYCCSHDCFQIYCGSIRRWFLLPQLPIQPFDYLKDTENLCLSFS